MSDLSAFAGFFWMLGFAAIMGAGAAALGPSLPGAISAGIAVLFVGCAFVPLATETNNDP